MRTFQVNELERLLLELQRLTIAVLKEEAKHGQK